MENGQKSVKSIRVSGVPNPRQAEFFASRAKYTAYGGARGGGKSWALRRKLVAICLRYAGVTCLLLRRTLGEVKSNHLSPFLAEYGSFLQYHEGEKCLLFPNGSRILFGYCACDRDLLRYQGQEYDVVAIDEATQLSEHQFTIFKACLRGTNPCPKRMYLTCNPGGIGHGWVKRLFIDRAYREGEDGADYRFISAKVTDNAVLLEKDPTYKKRLEELPPRLREAWLFGKWNVFEGQFFPEFDHARHVCEEAAVPKSSRFFLAFDYGFDMLAVLLMAVSGEAVYVVRELCVSGLTLSEAAARIVEAFGDYPTEYAVASPDLWNRRQDTGRSGFEIMQSSAGMPPMIPADDRRIAGWRVVREYLSAKEGGFRVCGGCTELIRCMGALLCDPNRQEDASSHPHSVTHAPEALRYALMSRMPQQEKEEAFDPFTAFCGKRQKPSFYN